MKSFVSFLAALVALPASAQVLLSDFSSLSQVSLQDGGATVTQNAGFQTLSLPPFSAVWYTLPNLNLSGLNSGQKLALTVQKAPGNNSNTLVVELYDADLNPVVGGQFVYTLTSVGTSSFTTLELGLPVGVAILGLENITQMTITGSPAPTEFTVVSLDNLALVPEPAAYGIAAGAMALGLAVVRRRRLL